MKDSRFIELLNLYVDHQLDPQEAQELDAEVHANPARHRTYLEYCRMQKACALLFENERAAAPASPALARALAEADRKISAHPLNQPRAARPRFTWWRGLVAVGGLSAAAACAAFAFLLFKGAAAPQPAAANNSPAVAAAIPAESAQIPRIPGETVITLAEIDLPSTAPVVAKTNMVDLKAFAKRFRMPVVTSFAQETDLLSQPQSTGLAGESIFAWTNDIQLRPIRKVSIEEAIANIRRFEKQQIGESILRVPSVNLLAPETEMTAIQFKR